MAAGPADIAQQTDDYISLTDIAKHKEPDRADHVIQNWMRNRNTVEFLGVWERLHNADFKPLELEGFRNRAALNSFDLTPRQWIDATGAMSLAQGDRLKRLNQIAIRQMQTLTAHTAVRQLGRPAEGKE